MGIIACVPGREWRLFCAALDSIIGMEMWMEVNRGLTVKSNLQTLNPFGPISIRGWIKEVNLLMQIFLDQVYIHWTLYTGRHIETFTESVSYGMKY